MGAPSEYLVFTNSRADRYVRSSRTWHMAHSALADPGAGVGVRHAEVHAGLVDVDEVFALDGDDFSAEGIALDEDVRT